MASKCASSLKVAMPYINLVLIRAAAESAQNLKEPPTCKTYALPKFFRQKVSGLGFRVWAAVRECHLTGKA